MSQQQQQQQKHEWYNKGANKQINKQANKQANCNMQHYYIQVAQNIECKGSPVNLRKF